jgi:hypothetical protein
MRSVVGFASARAVPVTNSAVAAALTWLGRYRYNLRRCRDSVGSWLPHILTLRPGMVLTGLSRADVVISP